MGMDLAALSYNQMPMGSVGGAVSLKLLANTLQASEQTGAEMAGMLQTLADPAALGGLLDIRA